jgi:DeoR/GlpR family transcriptional regulator of sugar metabolism
VVEPQAQSPEFNLQYHSKKKKKEKEKNQILSYVATCISLGDIILSEISQTQKDKYHMFSLVWEIRKLIS